MATGAAVFLLGAVFLGVGGSSFTYDEATYADLSSHPLQSSYYPQDPFLLHPPLSFLTLKAWSTVFGGSEWSLRAWAAAWSAGAVLLLGAALRLRGAPPALVLVPVLSLPAVLPLLSVSMYPPMVFFLALAAWADAKGRRRLGFLAWNLAVLSHELAILLLTAVLLPRAWRALRFERPLLAVPFSWLRISAPYPAAWAWGLLVVLRSVLDLDPRTADVVSGTASGAGLEILALKPLHTLALLLAATPPLLLAMGRRLRTADDGPGWGAAAFGLVVILLSPLYRYLCAPLAVAVGTTRAGMAWPMRHGAVLAWVVASGVAATGFSAGLVAWGPDPVNDADIPGLHDHRLALSLLVPCDDVGLRSPPALAYYMQKAGHHVVATAPDGPKTLLLEHDDAPGCTTRLTRLETPGTAIAAGDLGGLLLSHRWTGTVRDLEAGGWAKTGEAGGLVLLRPPR